MQDTLCQLQNETSANNPAAVPQRSVNLYYMVKMQIRSGGQRGVCGARAFPQGGGAGWSALLAETLLAARRARDGLISHRFEAYNQIRMNYFLAFLHCDAKLVK